MANGETTTSVKVTDLPNDVLEAIKRDAAKDGIFTDAGACRRALCRYIRGESCDQEVIATKVA